MLRHKVQYANAEHHLEVSTNSEDVLNDPALVVHGGAHSRVPRQLLQPDKRKNLFSIRLILRQII